MFINYKHKTYAYRDNLPPMLSEYIVKVEEVQTELSKIKLTKAVGPDNVPYKILKELVTSLASPVTSIINNSVRQGMYLTSGNLRE